MKLQKSPEADLVPLLIEATRSFRQFQSAEHRLTHQIRAIARIASLAGQHEGDTQSAIAGHDPDVLDVGVDSLEGSPSTCDTPEDFAALKPRKRLKADDVPNWGAAPLMDCEAYLRAHRLAAARRVKELAQQLHVWPFVAGVRGVGPLALGLIIGESADLLNYSNPSKLWKRMGLAVMDGRAQRKVAARADVMRGRTQADAAAEAIEMGYCPRRRSLMHVVGECLLKLNDGEYRRTYDERKAYEQATHPEHRQVQHHRRALRYMEKRFLLHLWQAWQRSAITDDVTQEASAGRCPLHEARA